MAVTNSQRSAPVKCVHLIQNSRNGWKIKSKKWTATWTHTQTIGHFSL